MTTSERCPQCGGQMVIEIIDGLDGRESWVCPRDAYAFAVDQEWANEDLEE